jgi:AcrR family transcriptional regulator
MPKLWSDTIDAHRRQVRAAVLAVTAHLAHQHGVRHVTMSRIAEDAGIGRATLYKYFPDVESILLEWHEEQVAGHLEQLRLAGQKGGTAQERLANVLETFASMNHQWGQHSGLGELIAMLQQGENATRAERSLHDLLCGLIEDAAQQGAVRADIPADELAWFCLASVRTAQDLSSDAAVQRLLDLVRSALSDKTVS